MSINWGEDYHQWDLLVDRRKQEDDSLIHLYPSLYKIDDSREEAKIQLSSQNLDSISYNIR